MDHRAAGPAFAKLAADDGRRQLTLFDQQDLAEISHPDYPDERLIACRNPLQAAHRAHTRNELLAATETLLEPIITAVGEGRLMCADAIALKVGKVINKFNMAKHLHVTITDTSLTVSRKHDQIDAETAMDGIYALRSSVPVDQLDPLIFASTRFGRYESRAPSTLCAVGGTGSSRAARRT